MARRMRATANREGRVWQRGDGRWSARAYPPEGRPRYVYGRTRESALEAKRDAERLMAAGFPGGPSEPLGAYLARWLAVTVAQDVAAGHLARSTLDSYADNTRLHILPHLGDVPLRKLTVSRVRAWQYDLLTKPQSRTRPKPRKGAPKPGPQPPLSPQTVKMCHGVLRRALNDALRDELVPRNVVSLVKPPKGAARTVEALTFAETRALLEASAGERLWCYWLTVLALGLRRGEGLGLRWADIDLAAGTVRLSVMVQRTRGEADPRTGRRAGTLVLKDLKTVASKAKVAVPPSVVEAWAVHQREQRAERLRAKVWLDADLVFTSTVGTAVEPRNVNRMWAKVCDKAGVRRVRVHDLRHACGTYLMALGVDPRTVQGTLRHSRYSTTEIYLHVLEEVQRDAAGAMDNLLRDLRRGAS